VKPAEAKLLALYITQYNPFQTSPVLNMIMNNHHQSGEFSFKSVQGIITKSPVKMMDGWMADRFRSEKLSAGHSRSAGDI
jgi:hypothetical protein